MIIGNGCKKFMIQIRDKKNFLLLKNYIKLGFLCSAFIFGISIIATKSVYAERQTARGTVVEMLQRLKQSGSYQTVLEYMHWQTAYKNLKPEEIKALNLRSPEDLQTHLNAILEDPSVFLREQYKLQAQNLPEEERVKLEQSVKIQIERIQKEQMLMQQRIKVSKFSIIKVVENADQAEVYVRSQTPGSDETKPLKLIRVDNIWYMIGEYNM
jgi:hypothetical protein